MGVFEKKGFESAAISQITQMTELPREHFINTGKVKLNALVFILKAVDNLRDDISKSNHI